MKHTFISRSLAIGCLSAVLVLCACGREDIVPTLSDGTITFGASSSWRNFPDTKTAYSGELLTVSGSKYERIDWVPGSDRVRIVSNAASTSGGADYADYAVQAVSGTNASGEVESPAALSPVSGGLKWSGEEQAHYFYALYPSPTMTSEYERPVPEGYASVTMTTSGGTPAAAYSLVVPSSQPYAALVRDEANSLYEYKPDMNLAYMSAAAKANAGVYDGVSLAFRPLVSTYEFTVMAADASAENLTLTAVTLTSSAGYLSGSFTTTVGPDGSFSAPELGSDKSNTVTVPVPAGADRKALSQSDGIRVTLFALPVEPDASETLTLDLTFVDASNAEVHRTLPLVTTDNTPITLPAGMKLYVRSLGVPGQWTYYLDDPSPVTLPYTGTMYETASLGTAFKSYKQLGTGDDAIKRAVPYKLQYSIDNGTTWSDTPPTWLPDAPTTSAGSITGEALPLEMAAQENSAEDSHHIELAGRTPKTGFDLSTINVATGATVSRTTANCYVVQAPGTYKFPLVYGNGVVNGEVNEIAYRGKADNATAYRPDEGEAADPSGSHDGYYLGSFKDHLDNNIYNDGDATSSPYLTTHLNKAASEFTPVLIWTDVPGLIDVDAAISGSGENAYVTFTVPEENITQGNALVAVLADGVIAWSWHIWVTDENLTNLTDVNGFKVPQVNLGWCDVRAFEFYEGRSCLVRAVQTEAGGKTSDPITVTQTEYAPVGYGGNCTYYQWGRKDPLQAADGTASNKDKTYYDASGNAYTSTSTSDYRPQHGVPGKFSIGTSIREPQKDYFQNGGNGADNWCSTDYFNLWNSTLNSYHGDASCTAAVTKTIYDPSPVGFKVPQQSLFTGFDDTSIFKRDVINGVNVGMYYNAVDSLFFPVTGYRYTNNRLTRVTNAARYWTASPEFAIYAQTLLIEHVGDPRYPSFLNRGYPVRPVAENNITVTGEDLGGWDTE